MKTLFISALLLGAAACSKTETYDDSIVGSWENTDPTAQDCDFDATLWSKHIKVIDYGKVDAWGNYYYMWHDYCTEMKCTNGFCSSWPLNIIAPDTLAFVLDADQSKYPPVVTFSTKFTYRIEKNRLTITYVSGPALISDASKNTQVYTRIADL